MKRLIGIATCTLILGLASHASAILMSDVGLIDPLVAVSNVKFTGTSETDFINSALGTDYSKDFITDSKIEGIDYSTFFMEVTDDTGSPIDGLWAFNLPEDEGYYAIKIGNGGSVEPDLYLFKNDPSTLYGTIYDGGIWDGVMVFGGDLTIASTSGLPLPTSDGVSFNLNNKDIKSISHLVTTPIPEPATMLLFGTGIVGLVGVATRRRKK